ncbi:MAG: GTP-binding protein [Thermoplasmata archaeon]|nr:GTP-binding protein [Thermoplasmata archaeon]
MDQIKRKVILIGDGAVGKTSLIRRFVLDKFDDRYITTIGTKVSKKEVTVKTRDGPRHMVMVIWDILGQQGYRSIQRTGYRGAEGGIMVCDCTRRETLESLEKYWIPDLKSVTGDIPLVFAANKSDLTDKRVVSEEELNSVAAKYGARAFSTSALTGQNVEEMFLELAAEMAGGREDSRGGEDDQYVGAGRARDAQTMTLVEATDWVIADFTDHFGGVDNAMPVIRAQFQKAGLDVKHPTKEALLTAIEYLAEVEKGFKSREEVIENRNRRRRVVLGVKE